MILGLIGGVGSGKSTITDALIHKYGYTVLYTDDIAKELEEPGEPAYEALTEAFGEKILENGMGTKIDKKTFADLIYADPSALDKVNSIVHPLVWDYVEYSIQQARADVYEKDGSINGVNIAVETALPCERFADMCDEIWFVYTDPEVRIQRLMESRGYSREKCLSIIGQQLSDEAFSAYTDYIIDNSGSRESTEQRIKELL